MQREYVQKRPKGLYLLSFTEMWERFSYSGMRALLVLYMIQQLRFSTEKAGDVYGLYTGFVYLTPIIGGYLADRYFGQRKCITTGAILMCIGLFMLALNNSAMFFVALTFMIIANGFFKSNISSVLGMLYGKDNAGKDAGFTIFYMGINLGALFSPLICGTVAYKFGFNWGFASAGIGMLIGLTVYKLLENKLLGKNGLVPVKQAYHENVKKPDKFTKREKKRLLSLFVLMLFTIVFWTCYEQAGSSLTLFAEYSTNRHLGSFVIPTGYFQALNPLYIIILAPLFSMMWTALHKRKAEPTSVEKFTIALALMGVAYVIMALAGDFSEAGKVSMFWLVGVYFIMTVAELCISPIGLSLVSKLAPKQFVSVLMGTWFLTSFFGNILAGFWGGKYGSIPTDILFLVLAGLSLFSAMILFLLIPLLKKNFGRI